MITEVRLQDWMLAWNWYAQQHGYRPLPRDKWLALHLPRKPEVLVYIVRTDEQGALLAVLTVEDALARGGRELAILAERAEQQDSIANRVGEHPDNRKSARAAATALLAERRELEELIRRAEKSLVARRAS